jgi:hypothetical protein
MQNTHRNFAAIRLLNLRLLPGTLSRSFQLARLTFLPSRKQLDGKQILLRPPATLNTAIDPHHNLPPIMAEGSSSGVGYAKTAQPARPPPSAFYQPQKAKETLSAVTNIPGQDKLMIFASEWVFKPEGVKAVKTRFERVLREHPDKLVCPMSLSPQLFLHVLVHLALDPLEPVHNVDHRFLRVRRWSN